MATPVQIYLSSSDATQHLNGTSKTDMLFLFKTPIIPPPNYNMSLRLVNMFLPISFTLVNSANDTLIINDVSYSIPHGNYTAVELKTIIMNLVAPSDPSFTVEFSSNTNKYTFSSGLDDFTIDGTCLYVLGFSGVASSTSQELISEYPVDLTGDNMVYVDIKNVSTFNLSSVNSGRTSIISSVLVDVPYGSVLYHEDRSNAHFIIQEDHLSFFHVRLYGEDQERLLDMNNFDWSLTLEIGFIQKALHPSIPSTYKDIYTSYIQKLMEGKK